MELFNNKFILFIIGFIAIYIINVFRCKTEKQFANECGKDLIIYCVVIFILTLL